MRRFIGLAGLVLFPAIAFAEPSRFKVDDIVEVRKDFDENEGRQPIDIVILSEGYTKDLRDRFMSKARSIARSLREAKVSEPMRTVNAFRFHVVWVPSREKGAPWRNGEAAGDTPFAARIEKDGTMATDDKAVDGATAHVVDGTNKTVTVVLVHLKSKRADNPASAPLGVRDPNEGPDDVRPVSDTPVDLAKRLCCSGKIVGRVRQADDDLDSFVHEFGHAAYGLDDEYADDEKSKITAGGRSDVARYPNTTVDPTGEKWRSVLPELFDTNGKIKEIHEGGSGFGKGVWHAFSKCRMNQSRSEAFCPVCRAAILRSVEAKRPLETPKIVRAEVAGRTIDLAWESAPADSFRVELRDGDKVVWKRLVEGHRRSVTIPVNAPKTFTVQVRGEHAERGLRDAASPFAKATVAMPAVRADRDRFGIAEILRRGSVDRP